MYSSTSYRSASWCAISTILHGTHRRICGNMNIFFHDTWNVFDCYPSWKTGQKCWFSQQLDTSYCLTCLQLWGVKYRTALYGEMCRTFDNKGGRGSVNYKGYKGLDRVVELAQLCTYRSVLIWRPGWYTLGFICRVLYILGHNDQKWLKQVKIIVRWPWCS